MTRQAVDQATRPGISEGAKVAIAYYDEDRDAQETAERIRHLDAADPRVLFSGGGAHLWLRHLQSAHAPGRPAL